MSGSGDSMITLMGLPRSGTTWLGKIFDSHPGTYYSHEPDSARTLQDVPLLVSPEEAQGLEATLRTEVEHLRTRRDIRVLGKLPLFPKDAVSGLPVWVREKELLALKGLARLMPNLRVPRHVAGAPDRADAWVWKSIESCGRLGALSRAFPDSAFVFILRHPCGVAASHRRGDEAALLSAGPTSEDYGLFELLAETEQARRRGLTLEKFRDMSRVDRTAWRWGLLNEKTLEDIADCPNCKVLRYEDLCDRPVETARKLFSFTGLSWNPQTEQFLTHSTTENDPSYFGVFKDPAESANKWKEELPGDVVERILEITSGTKAGELYASADGSAPGTV